jgi:hypothetical protein
MPRFVLKILAKSLNLEDYKNIVAKVMYRRWSKVKYDQYV